MEMPETTLEQVLNEFLKDQNNRLKPRTYNDYSDVISAFEFFLKEYGYLHVDSADMKRFEDIYKQDLSDEDVFLRMFGPQELVSSMYSEFFGYFIIRKMLGGASYIKKAARVIKKLTKWLRDHQYISVEQYNDLIEYFEDKKVDSLANAEKVSDMIFDLTEQTPDWDFEDIFEDTFLIEKIEPGRLYLSPMLDSETFIGPVMATRQITDLCETEWDVYLELGKYKGKWYMLASGNVYP